MPSKQRSEIIIAYPDPSKTDEMLRTPSVSCTEGAVAYRVTQLAPKILTEKVTFYTGFGWLSKEDLFQLRQSDPRIAP